MLLLPFLAIDKSKGHLFFPCMTATSSDQEESDDSAQAVTEALA